MQCCRYFSYRLSRKLKYPIKINNFKPCKLIEMIKHDFGIKYKNL